MCTNTLGSIEGNARDIKQRDGNKVRVFYLAEIPMEAANPGQDPAAHRAGPTVVVECPQPHP